MKFSRLILLLLLLGGFQAKAIKNLQYTLSMPEPHTHYYEVAITVEDLEGPTVEVKMPVWAPGSYLVREFSRHVEDVKAFDGSSKALKLEKTSKNTWKVNLGNDKALRFTYRVYAFELSVRTSFLDASHGYLNGTSVFMYLEGHQDQSSTVVVRPPDNWKQITTGLPKAKGEKWRFTAKDYDQLGDCPMEIGNHEVISFTAAGVPHDVAMYGASNFDKDQLVKDLTKVVEVCTDVFGENPNDYYAFIIHNVGSRGGGLEHTNSTTLKVDRWTYTPGGSYEGFISLAIHEYFHLWNVKRLRPKALGPFDYENENYTRLLWVMEGFTSYYDEYLMIKGGWISPTDYLGKLAGGISNVENQPGNRVQPVADASFDAWIKAYRPHENSYNTTISYYSKGSMLAVVLDLEIRKNNNGDKDLTDLMKYLYKTYYLEADRGFTDEELIAAVERFTKHPMRDFFDRYVYGTETLDYAKYLGYAGLDITNTSEGNQTPSLGVSTGSGLTIKRVNRGSAAYEAGLNVNDEIISINGYRVKSSSQLSKQVQRYKAGDEIDVVYARDGIMESMKIKLTASNRVRYRIKKQEEQDAREKKIYSTWLGEE